MYRRITSLFSFLLLSSHCWMASVWALVSPDVPRCSFPPGDYGRVVKDSNELNSILSFWTTQRGACQGLLRLKAGRTYHLSQEYVFDGPYNIKLTGGQRGAAAKASLAAPATIVKASTAVRHFSFVAGARIAMKGLRFLGSEMPGLRVPAYSQLCPTPFTSQPQDFGGAILLYSCPGRSRSQGTFTGVEFAGNHNRVGGAVAAGPWSSTRFDRCRFVQNAVQGVCNFYKSRDECTGTGGALALFDDTYVSDCTFEGNAAAEGGGGLYFCPRGDSSVVTVEGSRFYRNTVGFYGGAIALEDMATLSVDFPCGLGALTVRDSEFVGNVGVNGEILGGGIYNGQTLYLSCSWVVGNEAMDASGLSSTWGGGLYVRGMAGMGEWNRSPPYF
ncbi:Pectin lyase fold/virulence factor [Nannochloropsis gaditana]|uniref:Pectin lyase fold/virulence factor n=1 Tax=Nannochloropsis gaditana TaxID=72520 RepID=W7T0I6_9STRA|nr:Pectin lyase fold/virulence factor [Nannochloropsis gaditana]